jgi:hypothetical protein
MVQQGVSKYSPARALFYAILPSVLLLTGCISGDTPRRSLSELRSALLSHDSDKALRYIDVDSIVEALVRDNLLKYEAKADDPLSMLGLGAGKEMIAAVMPGLKTLARREVSAAITSDNQLGFFEDIKKASVWYLTIKVDGETAMVRPRGKSHLGFKMARSPEGWWRIVEIVRNGG